jgi:hypothetical protein
MKEPACGPISALASWVKSNAFLIGEKIIISSNGTPGYVVKKLRINTEKKECKNV